MKNARAPLRLAVLLAACLALAAAAPAAARAGRSYATPGSVRELVSGWTPRTHLYVLGDVGLEPEVLSDLEERLAGTHWTVVLVADASGETWKDVEGIVREGADAVEYGIAGIRRRKGFAGQLHPTTGEPDGTVLGIVLAQRALYYSSSQAQEARGLGDDTFAGNLDQPAIQALRNGGDVVGAITGTIENVDRQLAAKIEEARAAAERQQRQAQQAVEKVAAELAALETEVAALRRSFPSLDGPVVRPDLAGFTASVAEARAAAGTDPARASRLARVVGQKVEAALAVARAYPKDGETLVAASATLDRLAGRPGAASATPQIAAAREAVAKARELWQAGEPAYRQRLDRAKEAVAAAERAVDQAEAGALLLKSCLFAVLAFLGLAALVLLWLASRRRRPAKLEATALLASWRQALDRKLEALVDELEQRMERWVGPVTGEGRRAWRGETQRLADGIRADVGSLAILWTSANGVLAKAQALVEPGGLAALGNLVRSGRYRRATALLKDEPVAFDPGEGLPAIFGGERTWRDDLLGGLQSYQPFSKSFAELIAEFDERARSAADALEKVETAVRGADAWLDAAGAALDRADARAGELARASAADGLLQVPALAAAALPAGRAALARARSQVADDPVGTLGGPGALAEGIAAAAERLVAGLAEARASQLPDIAAARAEIGATLGLPPERMLREEGADPSALLAEAAEHAEAAAEALGRGDVTTAESAIADAGQLAAEAREVVEASRRSLAGHEAAAQREREERVRLTSLLPDRERTLERLERGFPPAALALRAGDPEHPSANGTVADNLAEAREHLETAQEGLRAADVARREGRLLEAADDLERVAGLHALAGHRLDEIAEKAARLDRTVTENAAAIAALERRLAAGEREIAADPRVTAPTVQAFTAIRPRVAAARATTGPTVDPFAVADELAAIAAALDEIETRAAPRDRERHAAAGAQPRRGGAAARRGRRPRPPRGGRRHPRQRGDPRRAARGRGARGRRPGRGAARRPRRAARRLGRAGRRGRGARPARGLPRRHAARRAGARRVGRHGARPRRRRGARREPLPRRVGGHDHGLARRRLAGERPRAPRPRPLRRGARRRRGRPPRGRRGHRRRRGRGAPAPVRGGRAPPRRGAAA